MDLPNEPIPAFKICTLPPNVAVSVPPLVTSSATLDIASSASFIPNWSTRPPIPNLSKADLRPPIIAPPRPMASEIFSSSASLFLAVVNKSLYKTFSFAKVPSISTKAANSLSVIELASYFCLRFV